MFAKNILFLDLGGSALKGIVINEKKFKIVAKQVQPCSGILNGYIMDSVIFQDALNKLIRSLEKSIKGQISATVLLVGSSIIKYKLLTSSAIEINGILDAQKAKAIDIKIKNWIDTNRALLIRSTPIEYKIDGTCVENPIGMYVDKLQFTYHIAYADMNQLGNLVHMLEKRGLNLIDIIPTIYACGALHLNEDERTLGALIFDIGAHSINWAYYNKNKPVNAGVIKFSSDILTHKIARGLKIAITTARELKHQHAAATLNADHFCTWAEFTKDGNQEFILQSEIVRKILPEVDTLVGEIQKVINTYSTKAHLAVLCSHGAWLAQLSETVGKNISMTIKLSPSAQPEFDALNGALILFQSEFKKKEKNILQRAAYWLKENL